MARVINLRQARKTRARDDKERTASENRARFGRTKAQKAVEEAEAVKSRRDHDAHRIERDDDV